MNDSFIKPITYFAETALDGIADVLSPNEPISRDLAGREIVMADAFFAKNDVQTEWWYYTGHCRTDAGREFGFELVFFKRRTDDDKLGIFPVSLIANPMYAAHFAISDVTLRSFDYEHRRSFGGILDTPVAMAEDSFDVQFGDWTLKEVGGKHLLQATLPSGLEFDAILTPAKPLVLNGDDGNGVSRKMKGASHHFSYTRMSVEGSLKRNGRRENFDGSAWMDREYGAWEQTNWDWFSIQFDDATELMIYQFRNDSDEPNGDSTGTFVRQDGTCEYLKRSDFDIAKTDEWTSSATGITYPASWRVTVPRLDIAIGITPCFADQELDTRGTTMVIYWEGCCRVTGTRAGREVTGNAYAELVGYDRSFNLLDPTVFLFRDPIERLKRAATNVVGSVI